jgi:hypothetical protein
MIMGRAGNRLAGWRWVMVVLSNGQDPIREAGDPIRPPAASGTPAAINVPEIPAQSRVPVHDQVPVPARGCPVDLVRYRVRKLSCPQRAVPKLPERPADLHEQG